jgi:hypothetical protein
MLARADVLKKFLRSFLPFLSLNPLRNRFANIPGPVDGDLSHPLPQHIVDLHSNRPHD